MKFNRSSNINISDYESLLEAAKRQPEPQRFLFVFLKVVLPKDYDEAEQSRFQAGEGGALEPVMCVDKALEELGSFADLVRESEEMQAGWQMVLVACMPGRGGIPPNSDEAAQPLEMMVQAVQQGGDLSRFMAFDRSGEPVQFT